jgi:hypothetical protein
VAVLRRLPCGPCIPAAGPAQSRPPLPAASQPLHPPSLRATSSSTRRGARRLGSHQLAAAPADPAAAAAGLAPFLPGAGRAAATGRASGCRYLAARSAFVFSRVSCRGWNSGHQARERVCHQPFLRAMCCTCTQATEERPRRFEAHLAEIRRLCNASADTLMRERWSATIEQQ